MNAATSGTIATPRAAFGPVLGWAHRRLGRRYPVAALAMTMELLYVVFSAAIVALGAFIDLSPPDVLRLVAATVILQTAYNAFVCWGTGRGLGPLARWLDGVRDERSSVDAWRAAASLPLAFVRFGWRSGFFVWANAFWCVMAIALLDLDASAFPVLLIGTGLIQVYAICLMYLALERAMRPLLADISCALPDGTEVHRPGVSLRWRLLAALPALNVVTGVGVGVLTGSGRELQDLALTIGISVAVTFTVSLYVTLLLSDSIVVPVQQLREAAARVGRGELEVQVPVVTTDETGALAETFNRMATGLRERERLHEAFGTFVDPDLAKRVMEEGTDLAGEEVDVSVVFLDVRDFTSWSERTEAHEVVKRLNALYERVVPVITKHGGHANKFVGDGMLAVFGAPEKLPDHADRAVAAALEVLRGSDGGRDVSVGVHSGRVLVGTIGGGGRLDFTVIGDTVNTAARVEAATRETGDHLLITEETHGRLKRMHCDWQERPEVEMKGKQQPAALFAPGASPG